MALPRIVSGVSTEHLKGCDRATAQKYIDLLAANNIFEVDNARKYDEAERVWGEADYEKQGFIMDTKILSFFEGAHEPEAIHKSFNTSLELLRTKKVHILYLHSPDRKTPFEITLRTINEIHQEGKFEKFGLSNFSAEEVRKILAIADLNGWIRPTVYQGSYNVLSRNNEDELFPLLKKEKISFYAYSPLASGLLAGKHLLKGELAPGSRLDMLKHLLDGMYLSKEEIFSVLRDYVEFVNKHNLTPTEVALRWLRHHSQLDGSNGDAVIMGGSKVEQFASNIHELNKGPLPAEVAKFVTDLFARIKHVAPSYHF